MEDQTLNQRLYQLVAPHPSPYLSPSCKHGTILPPPQGSARCQLPHRSKVESSRPVLFVGRYDWPICWPQPHLWPNLFVGWNIWYVTSPSVIANAGFLMLQAYKQALQKRFFSLEHFHTALWALLANVKALHDMPPCIKKMAVKHSSQRISTAKETTWCGCGFVGRSA